MEASPTTTVHRMAVSSSGRKAVYASLASDVLVALIKFGTFYFTASSAMMSEGVHSVVDAGTELLLLYGLTAATRRPTQEHQLGFGREIFFWNFIVAMLILALGSGVALWDGVRQIANPKPIEMPALGLSVIAAVFAIELVSLIYAARQAGAAKGRQSFIRYLKRRRDPTTLTVLFGGVVALAGLIVAAVGTLLSLYFEDSVYDGAASVVIAAILAVTAMLLASESKSLLIGVPADNQVLQAICASASTNEGIDKINGVVSVHLAPDQLLVALSVSFKKGLTTVQIEASVADVEVRLKAEHKEIVLIFVKPEEPENYDKRYHFRYDPR